MRLFPNALRSFPNLISLTVLIGASACHSDGGTQTGTGGATASGGNSASGGATGTGGASSGGSGSGGKSNTGGSGTGGNGTGGSASGGTGVTGSGGSASGGSAGGTSGGTGGTSASGGSVGTGGGSAPACILCEDFETSTSTIDSAKWVIDTSAGAGSGTAVVDSMGAHGSKKSLKVSGGYIKIDAKPGLFTGVAPIFYVRVNMRFDVAQPSGHVTYLMLADKTKGGQFRIGAINSAMGWNYDPGDSILPDYTNEGQAMSLKPPANEWHCMEFQIDGTTPSLHASMDGTESPGMLLDGKATQGIDDRWLRDMPGWKPNITNFSFGYGYPAAATVTVWYDDIAIANAPIGCKF